MRIQFSRRALFETTWYEYALRFLFGGLVTVAAGIIAKQFGPAIGGLFLAFPAIFPASATMIQTQQENKKRRLGLRGGKRAARAVSADAAGAAMGSIGLAVFALIVWRTLPTHTPYFTLGAAMLAWAAVAALCWKLRKAF
jgi:hypothetical protein